MYPAEYDGGSSRACGAADLVAAQGVAGVDADADNVARADGARVERLKGFVGDSRVAERRRRGGGNDEQPARRDDADAERDVAWVDQMDLQTRILELTCVGVPVALGRRRTRALYR